MKNDLGMADFIRVHICTKMGILILSLTCCTSKMAMGQSDQTYPVDGSTLAAVLSDMPQNGTGEAGQFKWTLSNVEYEYKISKIVKVINPDKTCTYTATAIVDPKHPFSFKETHYTVLPHWVEENRACAKVRAEWDRFLAALTAHEQGHAKVLADFMSGEAVDIAGQINAATADGSGPDADAAAQAAYAALDKIVNPLISKAQNDLQKNEDQYDTQTQHGQSPPPGTSINTSITCP